MRRPLSPVRQQDAREPNSIQSGFRSDGSRPVALPHERPSMRRFQLVCLVLAATFFSPVLARTGLAQDGEIRLLVRGDDMGVAQSVNEACIRSARDGIVRSVEVIVPGPWFLDAVRLSSRTRALTSAFTWP